VRFETEIADASPSGLHAELFRAAPEHGQVVVSFGDGASSGDGEPFGDGRREHWPRLADLAVRLTEDLERRLRANPQTAGARAVARQGMFQSVLTVDAASTAPGPAGPAGTGRRREVRTAGELLEAVGAQLLTNPTPSILGSAGEWVRHATDNELCRSTTGLAGIRTLRTVNTTVLVALSVAGFVVDTMRSLAEFAASLDGLFAGWSLELADHYNRARDIRLRVDAAGRDVDGDGQALTALARELEAEKLRLDDLAVRARSTTTLVASSSLVASPGAAESLRLLLEMSHFPRSVREFEVQIEQVAHERLDITIEKLARRREEQQARDRREAERAEELRERVQQAKLEVFLAVIAAAGMSGLVQVLQAGFFEGRAAALWAGVSVAGILGIGIALGLVFWPRGRR
jgi:hypothetical protein